MAVDGSLAGLHTKWFFTTSIDTAAFDGSRVAQRDLFAIRLLAGSFAGLLLLMMYQLRRLRRLGASARRASVLKTRFVANVCHELRTPLSGIVGLIDMLTDSRLTAYQSELLRMVRSTAGSLVQITSDLQDVAKVDAGILEIERLPFDPRATVEEVCAVMAGRAAEKGIRLEATLDSGLPRRVEGDATRLREVLMNLLSNALRFTNQGEVKLVVAAEQATPFQWLIAFTVSDTGAGIPPEDLARLFGDFEHTEAGREPVRRGTGLGLAIGKRLVDLMGGTMSVESPGGVGARFRFVLPFDVASGDGATALEPLGQTVMMRPLRVLVCEDDPVNRKVAVHLLTKLSHHVEAVASGIEAVEAAARQTFDLVLMDCQLPDIHGYDAAARIRSGGGISAGAPIIALTASALAEDRRLCEEAGMAGFLAKPLSLAALAEALAKFDESVRAASVEKVH